MYCLIILDECGMTRFGKDLLAAIGSTGELFVDRKMKSSGLDIRR